MNFVDIILFIPLLYAAWRGFKKGLVVEIFTLLALLVGIYAGIHFSDWTSSLIVESFDLEGRYLPVVAFTLTFLGVGAMVYFAGKMIERMLKVANLSMINRVLGIVFSLIKTLYILSVFITLLETYDERNTFIPEDIKSDSMLYIPVKTIASATIPAVEESTIWLRNNINNNLFDNQDISFEDIKKAKETADSLGITLEDLKKYKALADSLEIQ